MNGKLQKIYTLNLAAALVLCGILLVYFVLYTFSIIQVDSEFSIFPIIIIMVIFFPVNLFLRSKNKNHKLKLPDFLPPKILKILPGLALIVCIVLLAYGFIVYTSAPIRPDGIYFVDKSGSKYTYEQFRTFQKWEVAYIVSWSITALLSISYFPFYDGTSRKWRF